MLKWASGQKNYDPPFYFFKPPAAINQLGPVRHSDPGTPLKKKQKHISIFFFQRNVNVKTHTDECQKNNVFGGLE